MDLEKSKKINAKKLVLSFEHNPYDTHIFFPKKFNGKTIVFPIFNFQGYKQFVHLINPLVENGFKVVSIKLLNSGDRVLFFNYYQTVFIALLEDLFAKKLIGGKKGEEEIILMGFGISANLVSRLDSYKNSEITISKIFLLSPVNHYKSEYRISRVIDKFQTPTYVFFGQFDHVNDVNSKYQIFQNGRNNPNVQFYSYPATGYYLYYSPAISMDLDKIYKNSDYDLLIGESRKSKTPFLPSDEELNQSFFKHIFNCLNDVENPKKVGLLIDVYPLFVNGVLVVVDQLKEELDKLGYETYIISLWKKGVDFAHLPSDHHIPVIASFAKMIKGHKDLWMLKTFNVKGNAKALSLFGFDYLHLHTEYTMSAIALELSKITGIKMPYSYHTLWRMYYQNKFGSLVGDISFEMGKSMFFNRIYKECPVITVPSMKSYEYIKNDSSAKDVRIIPTPVNFEKFTTNREDREIINKLKVQYQLKGKKVLGYVGRISTEKNITETIYNISRIAEEIPNLVFMIVGVGDAMAVLQKYAKKLGIDDKIIYVGQVSNDELKYYYSLFDVFVTASNFETQGLTYFEAAASGTLILAKKDKALEGFLTDGVNAYIYSDFYQWVEKLEKALFKDNKKIVESARTTVKKYTLPRWAKQIEKIYIEINSEK